MEFLEYLKENIVILDGAMGTELQKRGLLKEGVCPELLSLTHAEAITDIHRSYVEAGSDVVYTNTFQCNSHKLPEGIRPAEVIKAAISNAKASGAKFVALDIGPCGRLIEPMGDMSFEEAYNTFAEQVKAGKEYGADLVVFETFTSLYELKAALLAAKENSDLPVICTMSFEGLRSVNGTLISSMALTLEGLGADAIGFNCSVGPKEIIPAAKELIKWTNLPVIVKVNAGLPNGTTYCPADFSAYYKELIDIGVSVIGGCCGTDPEYIKEIRKIAKGGKPLYRERVKPNAVCAESKTVVLDGLKLVGERINPTGKKPFKEALKVGDWAFAAREAVAQTESGAHLLDVNCGLPEIDESKVLPALVKRVQAAVSAPLMLDSSNPAALENALRVYNGIPIVNSVNGDPESIQNILPLVKKYGAYVIALALDQNGIPKTAEERIAVGNKIISACESLGIGKERVIIDALTLTAATGEYSPKDCLDTVRHFYESGIKTALGISNVSFGLPNRDIINATFFAQAAGAGLTLAIVNPSAPYIKEVYSGACALNGNLSEIGSLKLQNISQQVISVAERQQNAPQTSDSVSGRQQNADPNAKTTQSFGSLEYCVTKGLKEDAKRATEKLLESTDASSVIDNHLIKALDEVGRLYESGSIFLPELIASAEAAKAAFEVIREGMRSSPVESKGKIVLATVKGDIHDIGKNIVRAVLENYGYTVYDLGRDVPPEAVVETAIKENAPLVGLSALMTTTAANMEKTIALLKQAGYAGKVMVGGAVITEEYAKKIGADFYAKNANESASIAKMIFKAND